MPQPSRWSIAAASRMRLAGVVLIALVLVAFAVAWTVTPLSRVLDPQILFAYERQARAWPLAPVVVVATHVILGLIAAPGTLMIGATIVLFGVWPGTVYAFAGMLVNGVVVYAIGRFAARDLIDRWLAGRSGSRIGTWNARLATRGFAAIALLRLTPIPYSLQNIVAGASRVGFVDFVLGTSVGLLPVIFLMTGLATQFDAWLAHPDWRGLAALLGTTLAVLLVVATLGRWALRRRTARQRQ